MAENNTPAAPPAQKGKLKLIILLVLVIVLAVGLSVVGTLWFLGGGLPGMGGGDASSEETEVSTFRPSVYLDIEKALVTTIQAEGGRQRYAQVFLSLEADGEPALAAAELHLPLIRSRLVTLLGSSDFMELQTPDGRSALADSMLQTINQVLENEGEPPLKQVLFRNFVVQ
ncbi:flagellar basal body-associated FliL family protein [Marinobacter sp. DUT-3]|uniref:flagellar basal body-associated FliL family protein n=1 Tax=Marinobacter sp. DUT-3 TaxID=3412036 RepID=UPI003D17DC3D